MKKVSLIVSSVLMMMTAKADVHINWATNIDGLGRLYDTLVNATAGGTTGRLPIGNLIQLIYSTDNSTYNAATAGAGLAGGGNDQILLNAAIGDGTLVANGGFNITSVFASTPPSVGGFVYIRAFGVTAGNVNIGTGYYDSPFSSALILYDPLNLASINTVDATPAGAGVGQPGALNNYYLNQVVVPEPSTYAFMGIGALLLAIRRFRRS